MNIDVNTGTPRWLVDVDQNKAGTCPWAQMQVQPTRHGALHVCRGGRGFAEGHVYALNLTMALE